MMVLITGSGNFMLLVVTLFIWSFGWDRKKINAEEFWKTLDKKTIHWDSTVSCLEDIMETEDRSSNTLTLSS
jgi:hypothetical protein